MIIINKLNPIQNKNCLLHILDLFFIHILQCTWDKKLVID